MPSISPFLWFENQAEEAANFYVAIFPNSTITSVVRYPEGTPGQSGTVMVVDFVLDGQKFTALNGGPDFSFNESVSFVIDAITQADIDYYWERLTADGGQPGQCGWLKDRFGVSWQVVPPILFELTADLDPAKSQQTWDAMMTMGKLDIAALQAAHDR